MPTSNAEQTVSRQLLVWSTVASALLVAAVLGCRSANHESPSELDGQNRDEQMSQGPSSDPIEADETVTSSSLRPRLTVSRSLDNMAPGRVAFSSDGQTLASGRAGRLTVWRADAGVETIALPFFDRLQFGADGARLLAAPEVVRLPSLTADALPPLAPSFTALLDPHLVSSSQFRPVAAAFDTDDSVLVVAVCYQTADDEEGDYAGPKNRILLLNASSRELVRVLFEDHRREFRQVAISNEFIVAARRRLFAWRRGVEEPPLEVDSPGAAVTDLAFRPNGSPLIATYFDGQICLVETSGWTVTACWRGHADYGSTAAIHPTHPLAVTGGPHDSLRFWSTERGQPLGEHAIDGDVEGLAFDPSGRWLAVTTRGGSAPVRVFEITLDGD